MGDDDEMAACRGRQPMAGVSSQDVIGIPALGFSQRPAFTKQIVAGRASEL